MKSLAKFHMMVQLPSGTAAQEKADDEAMVSLNNEIRDLMASAPFERFKYSLTVGFQGSPD